MALRSLKSIRNLNGKVVFVRVDYNVPIKKKRVLDDTRIRATLPTIQFLIKKKAKIILLTHIGRPNGKIVTSLNVDPLIERLSVLIKKKVKKLDTKNWKLSKKKKLEIITEIKEMYSGQIAMMENLRFSPDEANNTGTLAKELAEIADVFVQDGFAVLHRESASVVGIPKYVSSCAGLLVLKEIKGLNRVLHHPKSPFVCILGGVKMETKIPLLKQMVVHADQILIGGGIVNTYLKATGYGIGSSIFDKGKEHIALTYGRKKKVILPVDVIVGTKDGKHYRRVRLAKKPHVICKKGEAIFDIGPETLRLYALYITQAKTLVWNGAMGYFEQKPYDIATLTIARLLAARSKGSAYGVIGGGETIQAMDLTGMTDDVDLVSTGGGAMLSYLAAEKLPGIIALEK